MRLKQMLALLCASAYLLVGSAAAVEPQAAPPLPEAYAAPAAADGDTPAEAAPPAEEAAAPNETPEEAAAWQQTTAEPSAVPVVAAAPKTAPSTHKVTVDGRAVEPRGYNIEGYNYYKLRDIAFLLNGTAVSFDVTWQSAGDIIDLLSKRAYTAVGGELGALSGGTLRVTPSKSQIRLDGKSVSIQGYNVNGNNYYKIADVAAMIGFTTSYVNETKTVQIQTAKTPVANADPEGTPAPETPAPETPQTQPSSFVPGVYRVQVSDYLMVRSGPGTHYEAVARLTNNTEVVIDRMEGIWGHLMTTGLGDRYCSSDYLVRVRDFTSGQTETRPVVTSRLDGVMTVIIDPGHGGSDIGVHNAEMTLDEKHVNLSVSQYLRDYLESAGARVIMVRETLEEGGSLSLRKQVMERYADSADLFFSVHHNAANTTARGAEALAQIADKNGGPTKQLGEFLLEEYAKLGIPIRQVVFREGSSGDYYYTNRVAQTLALPALTSEFCFIDNAEDQQFIDSEEDLRAEAQAQFRALMRYFENTEY